MGMASPSPYCVSALLLLLSLLFLSSTVAVEASHCHPPTHLHFYFHEIFGNGTNSTIARLFDPRGGINNGSFFGSLTIVDNMIREGKDPSSRLIGRVQGLAAGVSLSDSAFLTLFDFVFTEGPFKGSTLQVFSRPLLEPVVIERPIVSGTGAFRMARGYMLAKIIESPDPNNLLIIEFNAYVWHKEVPISLGVL
ncbi:hypothetical protein PR202_ga00133 [Eleusine coracana subsp. coracana]|uniref:Dirigent protein n=1 Tax=Eleusine coracana subsp. coracana TaxID=191504 RepID=A0AAV5BB81_ELECO|nr:hypothetical protein QOZ80_2AG0123230 [Eleusine coracana subsp. coracana]GJM84463.1 hypothetical protein PR202_ga00133 [Eleusine coracana subsp. coracana]